MKRTLIAVALLGSLLTLRAAAEEKLFLFEKSEKVQVEVIAIDQANRIVTLRLPGGEVSDLPVSSAVQNFDQLKPGDVAAVQVDRAVAFDLVKGGGGLPQVSSEEGSGRAAAGEKPGASWERTELLSADVVAVDKARGLVKLRGPQGRVQEIEVRDRSRLDNVAVGDQIQIRYKRALAMWVELPVVQ
ncbi:hypothetical protein [Chitinolyticbacter albus]|uniref:hypothetical protein n=1 Tax=Chitinolyticbacter albus TaxID=2961951 RepID=UPI00210E586B|nr:hypothetical protein [Chitinolyticbacter albus]